MLVDRITHPRTKADMKRSFLIGLGCLASTWTIGCSSTPAPVEETPPPRIFDAAFNPDDHDYVLIRGEYFKFEKNDPNDVLASPSGANWKPAIKIIEASGTSYKVSIPYTSEYPNVWIRVYGINETYSEPFLIHPVGRHAYGDQLPQ